VLGATAHTSCRLARSVGKGAALRIRAEEAIATRLRSHALEVSRELRCVGLGRSALLDWADEAGARMAAAFACVSLRAQLPELNPPASISSTSASSAPLLPAESEAGAAVGGVRAGDAVGSALAAECELLSELQRAVGRHTAGLVAEGGHRARPAPALAVRVQQCGGSGILTPAFP
jgi:hypothetical protein